jgi:hypothetical protein
MTTADRRDNTSPLIAWGLLAGGLLFLAGGPLHPKEDPPDVTVREHLRVMFENSSWYPAHALLLAGVVLIAAALVVLARGRSLAGVPRAQTAATVAAVAAVASVPGMLLHLVAASEAGAIAAGDATPLTDVLLVIETLSVPAFGFSIAALAVVGALTRTLGDPVTAVLGVVGGVGYGLAGATILLTDALNFLFPAATGIALWAAIAGARLLLRPGVATVAVTR